MTNWDIAVYIGAGYLAVVVLVRFMLVRRDKLLNEVRERMQVQARATPPRKS